MRIRRAVLSACMTVVTVAAFAFDDRRECPAREELTHSGDASQHNLSDIKPPAPDNSGEQKDGVSGKVGGSERSERWKGETRSGFSLQVDRPALREEAVEKDWRTSVREKIEASGAEVGLAFKDLETGESLFIGERLRMHAASTMKVPVMVEVFRQVELGKLSLDDRLTVRNEFRSIIDGSPFSLSAGDDSETGLYAREGETASVRELLEKMITVSSNLAANLLLARVGVSSVQETMGSLEAGGMKVVRCLEDAKAFEAGLSNTTDAEGFLKVMEAIADGRAAGADSCRRMVEILSRQVFRENIPAGLPPGVRTANKTGWITKICHDGAIVYPEGRKPYVLIVLTRGFENHGRAAEFIAELSRVVYEHVAGGK